MVVYESGTQMESAGPLPKRRVLVGSGLPALGLYGRAVSFYRLDIEPLPVNASQTCLGGLR